MERVQRGVMGWRVAVLAALALLSCATVPQAEVFQLPGGVTMTITQGCPIDVDKKKLKREDSDAFAINDTSVPSPAIYHGRVPPKSYFILMEAGSYNPGIKPYCTSDSLHSFIRIDGAKKSAISIRPVKNWADRAGSDALAGYERNVQNCKKNGPRWSELFTRSTIVRINPAGDTAAVDLFGGCEYHVDEMSQAMQLRVGRSTFIVSKVVDDLFVSEVE